ICALRLLASTHAGAGAVLARAAGAAAWAKAGRGVVSARAMARTSGFIGGFQRQEDRRPYALGPAWAMRRWSCTRAWSTLRRNELRAHRLGQLVRRQAALVEEEVV